MEAERRRHQQELQRVQREAAAEEGRLQSSLSQLKTSHSSLVLELQQTVTRYAPRLLTQNHLSGPGMLE